MKIVALLLAALISGEIPSSHAKNLSRSPADGGGVGGFTDEHGNQYTIVPGFLERTLEDPIVKHAKGYLDFKVVGFRAEKGKATGTIVSQEPEPNTPVLPKKGKKIVVKVILAK